MKYVVTNYPTVEPVVRMKLSKSDFTIDKLINSISDMTHVFPGNRWAIMYEQEKEIGVAILSKCRRWNVAFERCEDGYTTSFQRDDKIPLSLGNITTKSEIKRIVARVFSLTGQPEWCPNLRSIYEHVHFSKYPEQYTHAVRLLCDDDGFMPLTNEMEYDEFSYSPMIVPREDWEAHRACCVRLDKFITLQ